MASPTVGEVITSGFVALAIVVLWLAYYVPQRLSTRQDALDASLSDRFSGSLRVLAVGGGARLPRIDSAGASVVAPALASGSPRAMITGSTLGEDLPTTTRHGNILMSESADRTTPARTVRPHGGTSASAASTRRTRALPQSPSRIALLERRAAAARRRLTITVVLLLATIGTWVGVGVAGWSAVAGVVPTVLLAGVLVLGRRAVLSARAADAAWAAERRERAAVRAARGVTGGPVEPRNTGRVTGRAVYGSGVATQMIPRVTPDMLRASAASSERAGASRGAASAPETSGGAAQPADEEPARGDERPSYGSFRLGAPTAPPSPAPGDADVPSTSATGATTTDAPSVPSSSDAESVPAAPWEPVPVPRPTYTMKAAAPRREPAPLPTPSSPPVAERPDESASTPAPESTPTADAGATQDDPPTDTLGLNLNEILARRRAAGQ
ncbi:hypothetical protein SAMN04489860_1061 [Paraoerskovia marina]|uniref:Uncharacterized protein n=1 Tax=Paraoerskovia marina TaxID=545619 RepID=A0A1H1QE99_9CELL|nr:hypothetical protein [Paraoerskovia marina]SDS21792.1 hypothetical protein SAMN04489860_1061 [Paraoerskovia marina]